jgi:signal transduction histidine kinase
VKIDVLPVLGGGIRVVVHDDGNGFSPEMLVKFGERRDQRLFRKTHGGKQSLGLGSVIMKSVVTLHGGGAVVEFVIPKGHGPSEEFRP